MEIISVEYFRKELDIDVSNDNNLLVKAIKRATSFINSYTSKRYFQFDSYDNTNDIPLSPEIIVNLCVQLATCYYHLSIGEENKDGNERIYWNGIIDEIRTELLNIKISPAWYTETVSFDSDFKMLLGTDLTSNDNFNVIPDHSSILNNGDLLYKGEDWNILQGNNLRNNYGVNCLQNRWYLYSINGTSFSGNVHYMRTYKNDYSDYALYSSKGY